MINIDWEEYKEYKKHAVQEDKLRIVIDFIKSYYNIQSPMDLYDILNEDGIGQMMLEKRTITNAEGLERFIFKS